MALAALSAVAVLDVGSATADAAPSVSPFAGTYVTELWGPVPVTISDGGRITGSVDASAQVSVSGRVSDDGIYSITVSGSYEDPYETRRGQHFLQIKFSYKSAGNMVPDAAGNIVGTTDTGESFVWLRQ